MRFVIGVDCEGVACGVGSPGGTLNDSRNYDLACRQATREADAAARALFDTGAERVIVWDNHGGSLHLQYEILDERCEIALGAGFPHRWPGLEAGFDGVLFIGYHARDNVIDGPMCHTFSSRNYQWQKLNGEEVGELAIDAAVAGEMNVPPIFIASDDKAVAEARTVFGDIEAVQTKRGYGWNAAISLHPKRSVDRIYEGTIRAARRIQDFTPYQLKGPLTLERRFKRIDAAEAATRTAVGWERVDAYTVQREIRRITEMY